MDQSSLEPALDPSPDPFQTVAQDPFQAQAQEPSQEPAASAKDSNVSKTKIGLMLVMVAILLGSAFALIPAVFPLLLDPRLSLVAALPLLAGAALVFAGRHAWPAVGRKAAAGLALMVAGWGSWIVLGLLGSPYLLTSRNPPMDVGSPYYWSLLYQLAWEAANLTLVTVGILLLVWKITSEAPRRLVVAGNLIFLGYYVTGHGLMVALYDPSVGGVNLAAQPVVRILLESFLPILLVTNALQVVGLFFAQWRLPAPTSGSHPATN